MQAVICFGSVLRLHSEAIYKMTTRCQYNSELTTVQDKPRSQSNTGALTLKTMLWQLILFSSERHWTLRLYHCVVASDIMTIWPTTWSVADLQTAFIYIFFLKRCISVCTKLHAAMYLQIRKRDQTSPAFLLFKTDRMKEKPTNHRGWKTPPHTITGEHHSASRRRSSVRCQVDGSACGRDTLASWRSKAAQRVTV